MKQKFGYLLGMLLFVLNMVQGQNKIKTIKNETIKFEVSRKSLEYIDTNEVVPARYFIRVDLNSKQRREVKTLTKEDWMNLLNDIHSDWAANLILYDLYERDALLFYSEIKNKERWRLSKKEKDIQYWSQYLKAQQVDDAP